MPDIVIGSGGFRIDHTMGLVWRLAELLERGNGSDVTLRLETVGTDEVRVIRGHGLVLALQSPVFEEMLRNRNATTTTSSSDGSDTLVIRESADSVGVFDRFIR